MELNQRAKQVLVALIRNYIGTGDPVASRTVVRKSDLNLSPATVRNILADLDEMGFLAQPHASSGRVPTDLGYRFYVDALLEHSGLSKEEIDKIAARYAGRRSKKELDSLLQETSQILSDTSHYIGLVLAPRFTDVTYNHMEFIRMKGTDVLAILISQSGIVHKRMISTELDLSQEALDELSGYLNEELWGLTLKEIRERIVRKMQADMRLYDALLKEVFMTEELFESHLSQSRVYLDGRYNILDLPEFSDHERIKDVFRALEKKSILVELLDRSIHAEGVLVNIGSENPLPVLEDCSLIMANYKYNNKVVGTLGVIGPKRMDYSKVIPIVDCTAQLLSQFINV